VDHDDCEDDNNKCNGYPICENNVCVTKPGSEVWCSPDNNTACEENECQPDTGACEMMPVPEGLECNDDDMCTQGDECDGAGACLGAEVNCDDVNPCTDDSCDPGKGCLHTNNSYICDDGKACTVDDICEDGSCGGEFVDCNDENVCTEDECVPGGDGYDCLHWPAGGVCNDEDACTSDDACIDGVCQGAAVDCTDGNPCTLDQCDQMTGCNYPGAPDGTQCDDNNICTAGDECVQGQCVAGEWLFNCCLANSDCDDLYGCSNESCATNECKFSAKNCSDGNDCTADFCLEGQCDGGPLREPVDLYFEDFDDEEADGWHFTVNENGSDDIFWSVDGKRAASGKYSLYVGNPDDHTYDHGVGNTTAFSPPVLLPAKTDSSLSFMLWSGVKELGCSWDYVRVEVETGEGSTEELKPRICDQTIGWESRAYELKEYAGQSVRFLLTFYTTDEKFNDGEGLYFDDFAVVAEAADECCLFDGDCQDDDLCTGDICSEFNCWYPETPGTYFIEDFETGEIPQGGQSQTSKWHLTTTNEKIGWIVDDKRSFNSPYSLYCGNPEDHTYDHGAAIATARLPMFQLPEGTKPVLRFRVWAQLDEGGCFADVLKVTASTGVYGNATELKKVCTSTNGFEEVEVSLDGWQESVLLHLVFETNALSNKGEGIYVDQIIVDDDLTGDSCCNEVKECDDENLCTVDECLGSSGGGICFNTAVSTFEEHFDDGSANGWSFSSDNNMVSWQVDDKRSKTSPNSLYCGNTWSYKYYSWGAGTVSAATPYVALEKNGDLGPYVQYQRYVSVWPSEKHCLLVQVEVLNSQWVETLEAVCGTNGKNDNSTWNKKGFSLQNYKGESVRIKFTLDFPSESSSGINVVAEGAYIDDVKVGYEKCP